MSSNCNQIRISHTLTKRSRTRLFSKSIHCFDKTEQIIVLTAWRIISSGSDSWVTVKQQAVTESENGLGRTLRYTGHS